MLSYITVFLLLSMHKVSGYATNLCGSDHLGVLNGHNITIEEAPYMVSMLALHTDGMTYQFYCTATIIHERFLLTAARCDKTTPVWALVGSIEMVHVDFNYDVEKFIPHKEFNNATGENDICLVKLKDELVFNDKVAKITLADKDSKVDDGTPLNVTGWGSTHPDVKYHEPYLHRATVLAVSNKCCHDADKTVDDNMICAGAKGRGVVCHGDNGGPLTLNNIQVGIVSRAEWAEECGDVLDVFTRVSMYQDWINENIQNNL